MADLAYWHFTQYGDKILKNLFSGGNANTLVRSGKIKKKLLPFKSYGIFIEGTNASRPHLYIADADASDLEFSNDLVCFIIIGRPLYQKTGNLTIFNKGLENSTTGSPGYIMTTNNYVRWRMYWEDVLGNSQGFSSNTALHLLHDVLHQKQGWIISKNSSGLALWRWTDNHNSSIAGTPPDNFVNTNDFYIGQKQNSISETGGRFIIEEIMAFNIYTNNYQAYYRDKVLFKNKVKMKALSHMLFN